MASVRTFKGDSFVVNITPPDNQGNPSGVFVLKRKAKRKKGEIATEKKPLHIDWLPEPPITKRKISRLATNIGKAILKHSNQLKKLKSR